MSFFDLSVTGTAPKWAARQPVIVSRPPIKPPSFSVHPGKSPYYNRTTEQGYHPNKHATQHLINYTNQLMGAAREYTSQNKNKAVYIDKEVRLAKPETVPVPVSKPAEVPPKQKKQMNPSKVKPYRATRSRRAPQGVPKLNLSQLCEPDEEMMPIQLIPSRKDSQGETVRSWGSPETLRKVKNSETSVVAENKHYPVKGNPIDKPKVPLLDLAMLSSSRKYSHDTISDIESIPSKPVLQLSKPNISYHQHASSPVPKLTTAWGESSVYPQAAAPPPLHENRKLDRFTEEVLDKEMGKQSISAGTRSDSYLSFQNSVPTSRASSGSHVQPSDLTKRLRFGARILSRRGRDSARELCGFYFVGDNTMTIYEFRQFGQRSSALPFLQRRPYKHLIGELRDDQVLVGDIFSGLTLCFATVNQPSLPDPLKRYPRLYLRITQVDEKSKQELKAYLNGEEVIHRRSLLQTTYEITNSIQDSIWSILSKRSPKSLINFGRYLLTIDTANSGYLSKGQLLHVLKTFQLSLTPDQFQTVWNLSSGMETGGRVSHEQFRRLLLGGLPDVRRALMRVVLVKLDANKTGEIQLWQMKKFFCARRHPDVIEGKLTEEQCYSEFFSSFYNDKFKSPDTLSYAELEDYYEFVSQAVKDNTRFNSILKNCWGI